MQAEVKESVFLSVDPVIALIHNTSNGRWHPVVFVDAPFPGGCDLKRYRSKGHHTDGFDTRDAAVTHASKDLAPRIARARLALDKVFEWDGDGIPAITTVGL